MVLVPIAVKDLENEVSEVINLKIIISFVVFNLEDDIFLKDALVLVLNDGYQHFLEMAFIMIMDVVIVVYEEIAHEKNDVVTIDLDVDGNLGVDVGLSITSVDVDHVDVVVIENVSPVYDIKIETDFFESICIKLEDRGGVFGRVLSPEIIVLKVDVRVIVRKVL